MRSRRQWEDWTGCGASPVRRAFEYIDQPVLQRLCRVLHCLVRSSRARSERGHSWGAAEVGFDSSSTIYSLACASQGRTEDALRVFVVMSRERREDQLPTSAKVELVLRLLAGETLAEVSQQSGRPRRQLSAWRRRFLAGGEAYLDGRVDHRELEALRSASDGLSRKVGELEAESRTLERRVELLTRSRGDRVVPHPNCSESYARALEEPGVRSLYVAEWGTHVLVREGSAGACPATGVRPIASLDPACELRAGLDALARAGIASISLVTDPMWCPELPALQRAFDICRPFKVHYFVDRHENVQIRKRHRNRINQARRAAEIREIELAEHLPRWVELYEGNVTDRQISQPFSRMYFQRLAELSGLRSVAVLLDGEIVTITLWICHENILYFHDGASSPAGFAISASYAAFAHAIESIANDCRYVFLGGSADFRDELRDGLAVFKRGFANASAISYLCSATLDRAERKSSERALDDALML